MDLWFVVLKAECRRCKTNSPNYSCASDASESAKRLSTTSTTSHWNFLDVLSSSCPWTYLQATVRTRYAERILQHSRGRAANNKQYSLCKYCIQTMPKFAIKIFCRSIHVVIVHKLARRHFFGLRRFSQENCVQFSAFLSHNVRLWTLFYSVSVWLDIVSVVCVLQACQVVRVTAWLDKVPKISDSRSRSAFHVSYRSSI